MTKTPSSEGARAHELLADTALSHGEQVAAEANRPIRLDDGDTAWFVESGSLDVFLVEFRDSQNTASWQHLLRVGSGRLVPGVGGADGPLRLVAKGLPDTQLRRLQASDLASDAISEGVAGQVDAWVSEISSAVASRIDPRPRTSIVAGIDRPQHAPPRSVLSAAPGNVVWVWAPQRAAYLGTETLDPAGTGLVPLTSDSWLSVVDAADVAAVSASELSRDGRLLEALEEFHRLVFAAELLNRRLLLADEVNERTGRAAHHRLAAQRARRRLFGVLASSKAGPPSADTPLMRALEVIGEHDKIEFRSPVHSRTSGLGEPSLADILRASGVRARQVRLADSDRWWRSDSGPMLAQRRDDGHPVALVPGLVGRYRMVDPDLATHVRMRAGRSQLVGETAWCFYRPLPADRPVGWAELAWFTARNTAPTATRFVVTALLASMLALAPGVAVGTLADWILPSGDTAALGGIVAVIVALAVATGLLLLLQGVTLMRLEGRAAEKMGSALMDRLLDLPVDFFRRYTAGDLITRMETVWKLRDQVSGVVVKALLGVVFLVPVLGFLFLFNTALAVLSLVIAALALTATAVLGLRMVAPQRRLQSAARRAAGDLLQFIGGISKLRSAGAEGSAFATWARSYREQLQARQQIDSLSKHLAALSTAVPVVAAAALFAAASSGPSPEMTAGEFLVIFMVSGTFFVSVAQLGAACEAIAVAVPLCDQLSPIISAVPQKQPEAAAPIELRGELRFDQVSFRYHDDGPLVLDQVDVEALPGEFVAIVGASGSGKSTLMRMALGLEAPSSGTVYYDGHDLANLSTQSVRRQVGVAAHDGTLQPGNILDNIIGIGGDLTIDDAWRAARLADVDADIAAMPMQMFTVVGDSTATFSGGQMQRIKIAAALVRNPQIVLMDEATSWLDAASQARVMQAIEQLAATRVVIAHRLSTIRQADRIYVMSRGRVVQHGTYEELHSAEGAFYALVQRQLA
ncbi:ATP-binding cassette domain-containing protein [Candidatus Poriferisodalis sp.]|uniref:ATP-binding cassette domain-containing protein n=1 Tax=Candidatus Poriferisodalis sp. TaxID=3101277 RepID=UPI003B01DA57